MPDVSLASSSDGPMDDEPPHLSTASLNSNERAPSATPSDSSERRPVSLISTLSSGSGSSRDDNPAPEVDSDLRPADGTAEGEGRSWLHTGPDRKGRGLEQKNTSVQNNNNNNIESTLNRAANRRQKTSPFKTNRMAPNPQLTYLDRVVLEIIETERMYVRDLRMIVEDYLAHIIDQCDVLIRPEQVCALFGNIEDIYEFNSELLQALDLCHNDPVAIARCFVMKSEYFEIYTQYCTNYPNSVAALTDCMRNKTLAKFFRERQAALKRSLPLGSYLLKPVQRILKYHLLLQEIAKHFDPEEEEGYEAVEDAIYTMTGVAWYINDMKRKHEHAVRLQEVQSLLLGWKGPDLTTYGELVLEGTFKAPRAKNDRTLFLFERTLLITRRRGEHYAYKTHISCATLMLIESAKDSLSFSVTHYKRPKQPLTVQAKTVEERKLWAHHIKRIILENHRAIIPQKAKDAIMEMNPSYPPRYRYGDGRHGRRQSEPVKQAMKSSKGRPPGGGRRSSSSHLPEAGPGNPPGVFDVLQHSEIKGAVPGSRRSLQPATSMLAESEAGHASEEEEEELGSSKDSMEHLVCSDEEEAGSRQTVAEDMELDEQVDDFATSVLAAISFWGYRVTMVTEVEGGHASSGGNKENGRLPAGVEPGGAETAGRQVKAPKEEAPRSDPAEIPGPEPPSDPDSLSSTPPRTSPRTPAAGPELSGKPDSDSKALSSEEFSEDGDGDGDEDGDVDGKEAAGDEGEAPSILPPSVLDRASTIAQHFTNSIKRGSLIQEDSRPLGCASPRQPNRSRSSLATEPADLPLCSETAETAAVSDLTLLSPWEDAVFNAGRGVPRRRDSALSRQDQLLIGKIRSYYESQDANFSLQRRESLTYIPTGLVRSSVSRINSVPKGRAVATATASGLDPNPTESILSTEIQAQTFSGDALDASTSDRRCIGPEGRQKSRDDPPEDDEFRPSSEMIRIWQLMERDLTGSHPEDGGPPNPSATEDAQSKSSDAGATSEASARPPSLVHDVPRENQTQSQAPWEDTVLLKAPVPRLAQLKAEGRPKGGSKRLDEVDKTKSSVLHLARQYSQRIKAVKPAVGQRRRGFLLGETSLACVDEEKDGSGTVERRNRRPPPLRRVVTKALLCVPGKTNPTQNPVDPVQSLTAGPACSSERAVSPGRARSHSPPQSSSRELFNWPDVRELRSKYSAQSRPQKNPVTRTSSVPDQMFDGGLRRQSTSSKPHGSGDGRSTRLQRSKSLDPRLSGAQMTEDLQGRVANSNADGYYVAAEAPLPSSAEHKIVVMEKIPEEESAETAREPNEEKYVQIRSPTSKEKISIMAVIDRCRVYQESDEYKQREEARTKTEPESPGHQDNEGQTSPSSNSGQKTDAGPQGIVKHLRERFQSLG
ncbi:pleckstrin homology domain-containing family G member 3-like [Brachionichthys hirsutus]|uniref:pleckstrin homology domain-containing family G member 3-like n=1 Tax=Brachionichthys hirsutus TaxID=412623 RepID=UPI0036047136